MGIFKNSIATKFSLLIITLVVMTVLSTGLVFYKQRQSHQTGLENEALLTDLKVAALKLSSGINSLPNAVGALSKSPSIQAYFLQTSESLENEIVTKARSRFLAEFARSWSFIGSLCLKRQSDNDFKCFDKSDQISMESSPDLIDIISNFLEDNRFSKPSVKRIAGRLVQPLLSVMYYRLPVTSVDGEEIVGEIFVEFLLENNIQEALLELKHSAQMMIFDDKGDYLYHPSGLKNWGSVLGSNYNAFSDFPQFLTTGFSWESFSNSDYLTDIKIDALTSNETYGVGKVVLDRKSKIFLNIAIVKYVSLKLRTNDLINTTGFILLGAVIVFGTVIGWFFSGYLTRYLEEITSKARQFAKGETDIHVEVKSNDEIGVLATAFQGMVRQVNERTRILRKNEREIREARDQAEEALKAKSDLFEDLNRQKNEIEKISKDKDDLLAIVSHDLKNPMAVIETSMDILIEDQSTQLSPTAQDLIRRSKNSAKFALNLITDLLDLARLEGGIKLDFEKINISEMFRNVLDGFELKAKEKNISIKLNADKEYEIYGDYGRIVQVIHNILGNALKFTPHQGRIEISVSTQDRGENKEKLLVIKISDNGPGIPSDKIDLIFNKFEQARTSDRAIGTGLGLAISKNIVQLHNGQIKVDSVEGEGSTFTIELPRVISESTQKTTATLNSLCLVYNDNPIIDRIVKQLHNLNFKIDVCHNAEQFVDLIEKNQVKCDVFLIQWDMPFNEEKSLIHWISENENYQKVPIVALSEKVNPETIESVRGVASEFFGVSFPFDELKSKIYRLIKRGDEAFQKKLNPAYKTIMVVEDEEGIRDIVAEKIQSLSINAIKAKNGVEALFLMKKYSVDLILTDIRMPELDGLSLARLVKKAFPNIDIILMSSTTVEIPSELMEKLGIKALLSKPFDIDTLDSLFDEYREGTQVESSTGPQVQNISEVKNLNELPQLLLVDDSEDMHLLFDVMLKNEKVKIVHCHNGQEAIDLFKSQNFDVIFMDVNMPVLDGIESVKQMRKIEENEKKLKHKIIVISANQSEDDMKKYQEAGFSFAVSKPINRQKILDAINKEIVN